MFTKSFFEKFATPISIVVAGALIGVGIAVSKSGSVTKPESQGSAQTEEQVIAEITKLPILKKLKVKEKELAACIEKGEAQEKVAIDIEKAIASGLQGTPHMIVIMNKDGKEIQFPLFGALPKETIESAIAAGQTPVEQAGNISGTIETQVITEADHIQGNPDAPVTIVEYSDIDCPYCKRLHTTLQSLVDEGKIKWVYRHSPIPQLHPFATTKAIATECVAEQAGDEGFWKYLEELMKE